MIPLEIQMVIAVFVGVTMVVYLVVLVLLATAKSPVLHNSFYQLNIALGIADMGNLAITNLLHRLPNIGFISMEEFFSKWVWGNILPEICNKGGIIVFCWQKYFLLVIALNRFTAVFFPVAHETIWSRRNLLVIFSFALLAATGFAIPSFFYAPAVYVDLRPRGFNNTSCTMINLEWVYSMSVVMVVFVLIATVCNFIFSIATIIVLVSRRHKGFHNVELKLFLMTLLLTVLLVVNAYTSVMGLLFAGEENDFIGWNYLDQDLLSAAHPYLLLTFSTALRQRFRSACCPRHRQIAESRPREAKLNMTVLARHQELYDNPILVSP